MAARSEARQFSTRPRGSQWPAALSALLLSGVTLLGVGAAGGAAQAATAPLATPTQKLAPITHPQSDTPGSQIRLHEKQDPASAPRATVGLKAFATVSQPYGMDVSNYQGNIDWAAQKAAGASFVYIKATENTTFQNAYFAQQYNGAYAAGLIRGAYHFALPDRSSRERPRLATSSQTAAATQPTATRFPRCWTSSTTPTVRIPATASPPRRWSAGSGTSPTRCTR